MEIPFPYISTFISLIFGFAIMHAFSCISTYIQNIKKIQSYWVWWVWTLFVLMISCAIWWNIFDTWSHVVIWKPYYFLYLVFFSCVLYLLFFVHFDFFIELDDGDLEKQFYSNKKPFFLLLSLQFLLLLIGSDIVLSNFSLQTISDHRFSLLFCGLFVFLGYSNNRIIHAVCSIGFLITLFVGAF